MSVYFAKVGRYIKVGYSSNPERRVANLFKSSTRYARPYDLSASAPRELLLVIDGATDVEHRCHEALGEYAAGCEFFVDEPGVREFMAAAQRGEFPTIVRPEGQFERCWEPEEEWQADVDRMLARARARSVA